jgi:hypothetical protein
MTSGERVDVLAPEFAGSTRDPDAESRSVNSGRSEFAADFLSPSDDPEWCWIASCLLSLRTPENRRVVVRGAPCRPALSILTWAMQALTTPWKDE